MKFRTWLGVNGFVKTGNVFHKKTIAIIENEYHLHLKVCQPY